MYDASEPTVAVTTRSKRTHDGQSPSPRERKRKDRRENRETELGKADKAEGAEMDEGGEKDEGKAVRSRQTTSKVS